jgi:hypothetical protein
MIPADENDTDLLALGVWFLMAALSGFGLSIFLIVIHLRSL